MSQSEMTINVRLDNRGRVLIPKEIRDAMGIVSPEKLIVEAIDGALLLRRAVPRELQDGSRTDAPKKRRR